MFTDNIRSCYSMKIDTQNQNYAVRFDKRRVCAIYPAVRHAFLFVGYLLNYTEGPALRYQNCL